MARVDRPWHIVAEFPSEADAGRAYEAVAEFIRGEVEYCNSLLRQFGYVACSNARFDTREGAERWVRNVVEVASRMGRGDRVRYSIRMEGSEALVDVDFGAWLQYASPQLALRSVRLQGRVLDITLSMADECRDRLLEIIREVGGEVLRSGWP